MSNVLKSKLYIDKCSTLFIEKLGHLADTSQAFDLGQWLQMYAFDVIGELHFGQMFGFMEKEYDHESLIHSLDILNPLLAGMAELRATQEHRLCCQRCCLVKFVLH